MARTPEQIEQIILNAKARRSELNVLTNTSSVSIWRLFVYIVAVGIWSLEQLFDLFKADVDETIAAMKPHSLRWYALKAKAFMYGYDLVAESDYYDTTGLTETQIAEAKIVSHAAVVEVQRGLRIKVAKTAGDALTQLDNDELEAFTEYMQRVKDAGIKLLITSGVADNLKLSLKLYYNPLVLNASGARLDGTSATPVQDAVKAYLKNLPFNGVFVLEYLVDALQKVDGVVIPHIVTASARYGALPFVNINVKYTPDAGYLALADDNDLQIEWIAQPEI